VSGRERLAGDDAGFSIAELLVTMAVLSVVMAMFTAGIMQMFNVTDKGESLAVSQAQNTNAFLRLDKQIRYANGISSPGVAGGDPYVEYLISGTGTPTCYELRVTGATLQQRVWVQGAAPTSATWIVLASGVANSTPFTFIAPNASFNFQRLQLKLTAVSGLGTRLTAANTDVTFTALNTSLATSSPAVCIEGRTA
jgi:prepilin-type N-terminal cleavage/methylation domain-containing protein